MDYCMYFKYTEMTDNIANRNILWIEHATSLLVILEKKKILPLQPKQGKERKMQTGWIVQKISSKNYGKLC